MDDNEKLNSAPEGNDSGNANSYYQNNSQYDSQYTTQEGYVPYSYNQGPEVPEPKRNNRKLGIIIGSVVAAVAVIAIVCAVLVTKLLISDKARVTKALGSVGMDMVSSNPASVFAHIGTEELFKKFRQESMKFDLSLELDEYTGTDDFMMSPEGFQMDMALSQDMPGKQLAGNLSLGYLDTEIFTAGIYADADSIAFSLPLLYEGYLRIPSENIISAYNASALGQNSPAPADTEFSMNLFANAKTNTEMSQIAVKLGSDALILYDNMTVEKVSSDRQFTLDGKTRSADKYVMTIKNADFVNLCNNFMDAITASDELKSAYGFNGAQLEEFQDGFNRMVTGDIIVDVYLAGSDVACIEARTPLAMPYEESDIKSVDLTASVNFGNSAAYNQDYDGRIALSTSEEFMSMDVTKDTIMDGDKTSSEFSIYMDMDESFLDYTFAAGYDKKSGSYTYNIDVMVDNETFTLGLNGMANDIKEGTSCDLSIDDMFMEFDGQRMGFSGNISAGPLDGDIEKPTEDFRDLFDMSEDEVDELMTEIQTNLLGSLY